MASHRARPSGRTTFVDRLPRQPLALVLVPFLFVGAVVMVRAGGLDHGPRTILGLTAGVAGATPEQLTATAAGVLAAALAKGGGGIEFEIVQTSTITARPGGPLVEVPDPADRTKSLGSAERYPLGTLIERGVATPDGFWMELIHGPEPGQDATFDLATALVSRQALVRDGTPYRNDGQGWHETEQLPGIGLDPATVALLPALLSGASAATDVALEPPATAPTASPDPTDLLAAATVPLDAAAIAAAIAGLKGPDRSAVRALEATTTVADSPGIIAIDLATATEITAPARFTFDDAGRLVSLTIVARNTRLDVHDLVVETLITFRYPGTAPELPKPEPAWVAPAATSDGA